MPPIRSTPRLTLYAGLGAAALVAGLAMQRAELVVVSAPFLLMVLAAVASSGPAMVSVAVVIDPDTTVEQEAVRVTVRLTAARDVACVEVWLPLPDGMERTDAVAVPAVALREGVTRDVDRTLRGRRWGAYRLDAVTVRVHDRLGLLVRDVRVDVGTVVRVRPRPEHLARMLTPLHTQAHAGNITARRGGEGLEFADVRLFTAGDRVRRVNWRLSTRRGELHVNVQHPERNADVILLLDAFTDVRSADGGTLEEAVRAAATLAARYLRARDRVGVVGFGGVVRWLAPAGGTAQMERIVSALLDTSVALHYAWKDIRVVPPRLLPPHALVVALSPLLDDRVVTALLDLRARHHDLAVLDVSPLPFAPRPRDAAQAAARRLWALRREALRDHLRARGIAVAAWEHGRPLDEVVEEVRSFRRSLVTARR